LAALQQADNKGSKETFATTCIKVCSAGLFALSPPAHQWPLSWS